MSYKIKLKKEIGIILQANGWTFNNIKSKEIGIEYYSNGYAGISFLLDSNRILIYDEKNKIDGQPWIIDEIPINEFCKYRFLGSMVYNGYFLPSLKISPLM